MLDEDPPVIEEVIALDEAIMEEESPNIQSKEADGSITTILLHFQI